MDTVTYPDRRVSSFVSQHFVPVKVPVKGQPDVAASYDVVWTPAVVVGDVILGEESSVWYGSVLRGDVGPIRVGARTNIQDGCILHVTGGRSGLTVGSEVTAGHRAIPGPNHRDVWRYKFESRQEFARHSRRQHRTGGLSAKSRSDFEHDRHAGPR